MVDRLRRERSKRWLGLTVGDVVPGVRVGVGAVRVDLEEAHLDHPALRGRAARAALVPSYNGGCGGERGVLHHVQLVVDAETLEGCGRVASAGDGARHGQVAAVDVEGEGLEARDAGHPAQARRESAAAAARRWGGAVGVRAEAAGGRTCLRAGRPVPRRGGRWRRACGRAPSAASQRPRGGWLYEALPIPPPIFFYKANGTTDRRLYRRQDIEESLRAPW